MKVQITIHTELGTFESDLLEMTRSDYEIFVNSHKNYFEKSLEMPIHNGLIILSPTVTNKSILELKIKKKHVAE